MKAARYVLPLWVAASTTPACKSDPTPPTPASVVVSSTPAPSASASAAPAAPWFEGTWKGGFEAKAAPIQLAEKAANEKAWSKDDGSKSTGKGELTVTVDSDGKATGAASGALGEATLDGAVEEERVTLRFEPKDPTSPEGLSGVIVLTRGNGTLDGELKASTGDSLLVRKASITLKKAQ